MGWSWGDHELIMRWSWGDHEVIMRWSWGDHEVIWLWGDMRWSWCDHEVIMRWSDNKGTNLFESWELEAVNEGVYSRRHYRGNECYLSEDNGLAQRVVLVNQPGDRRYINHVNRTTKLLIISSYNLVRRVTHFFWNSICRKTKASLYPVIFKVDLIIPCQLQQEYAPVWGCAWNLKPFSWAVKKNTAIILICPSNLSKQFLAPGGLSAECVQVTVI